MIVKRFPYIIICLASIIIGATITFTLLRYGANIEAFAGNIKSQISHTVSTLASNITNRDKNDAPVEIQTTDTNVEEEPFRITLGTIDDISFVPDEIGKTIRVNLETMELSTYENGTLQKTYKVLAKGKPGSYWETPGGEYQVLTKEERHLSSVGKVWMPYSLQFFGNFFIHGWPYYQSGEDFPVGSGYSGGCIRLSTKDAEELYSWTDITTRVSIYSTKQINESDVKENGYFVIDPKKKLSVGATSFLVGDIETGEIILEKNSDQKLPIASVTKLMTALTSLDVVSQRKEVTILPQYLEVQGQSGDLRAGEKIGTNDLIYPLLLESSNDAGEALAGFIGRGYFIKSMNDKAQAIGMTNSSFADPTGLSKDNISTSQDLFRLAKYLKENKQFLLDASKEKTHTEGSHTWYNTSQFLNTDGYEGGKRGYTDPARETNLGVFTLPVSEFHNRSLAIVVLGSEDRYRDTKNILDYLRSNIYFGDDKSDITFYVPPPAPRDTTLVFGGDVMLDRGVKASVEKNFAGDFSQLFSPLTKLKDADIAFINLEGPVSDVGNNVGSKYSFRMDTSVVKTMKDAGIDIVSFANNHVGDWNKAAFDDTLRRLMEGGILYTGAGKSEQLAETPVIIDHNSNKIGFLGASDVGPEWVEAKGQVSGILLANDPKLPEIIKNASEKVDILVVSFHWGDEYKEANDRQKALAHMAIDNGADLVIGHHPHVIEESEWYKDGYIAYSLGNLIFDQYFSPETMQGLLLEVEIEDKKVVAVKRNLVKLNEYFQPYEIRDMEE
jgi:poly-gamma-glutamate synthesis protein (capsule biosynthesis protein)